MYKEIKIDPNWVPFYFESNLAWGWVNSPEDWERIQFQYKDAFDPSLAKQYNSDFAPRDHTSFGFYSEYGGSLTLKEWTKKLGMKL